jgi:hypothetical protein
MASPMFEAVPIKCWNSDRGNTLSSRDLPTQGNLEAATT